MKDYQILLYETEQIKRKRKIQYGDLDMDGDITNRDSRMILQYIGGGIVLSEEQKILADVTGGGKDRVEGAKYFISPDGKITEEDAKKILEASVTTGGHFQESPIEIEYVEDVEKYICEIGSSVTDFAGKATNVVLSKKIDGTKELSFSLPRSYFDELLGEEVNNQAADLITNKSKIKLIITEDGKEESYYFSVNERTDTDNGRKITYSYSCNDAFIEELSKTGYSIAYSGEVGGNGTGTIHELARVALEGSDWEYDEDKTGFLMEYDTKLEYKSDQGRYDVVTTPVPTHSVEYNKVLDRYCYLTTVTKGEEFVYCYEDTNQITSSLTKNILYGSSDFSDTSAWSSFVVKKGERSISPGHKIRPYGYTPKEGSALYSMLVEKHETTDGAESYMVNTTAADTNTKIEGGEPYIFYFRQGQSTKGYVKAIYLTGKHPAFEPETFLRPGEMAEYALPGPDSLEIKDKDGKVIKVVKNVFLPGKYYVIKTQGTILNPYFTLRVNCGEQGENLPLYFYNISLFKAQGKNTKILPDDNTEENDLLVLSSLYNGMSWKTKEDLYSEDLFNAIDYPLGATPPNETSSQLGSYTQKLVRYFYNVKEKPVVLKLTKDQIEYYKEFTGNPKLLLENESFPTESDIETWYSDMNDGAASYSNLFYWEGDNPIYYIYKKSSADAVEYLTEEEVLDLAKKTIVSEINAEDDFPSDIVLGDAIEKMGLMVSQSGVYKHKKDNKLYQFYSLKQGKTEYGKWNLAFLDDGVNNKRRSLAIEKSNRFNILQKISELFKTWCVFDIKKNDDGTFSKKIWFREREMKENFSGFHKGVNLQELTRKVNSYDLVTKMLVENQENKYSENGFVSISNADENPWGEKWIYNFRHYVDSGLLKETIKIKTESGDEEEVLEVDEDLRQLYSKVKSINVDIIAANNFLTETKVTLNNYKSELKVLSLSEASLVEEIASATADLDNPYISDTDKEKRGEDIKNYESRRVKILAEKETMQIKYDSLKEQIDMGNLRIEILQNQKTSLIENFENKYSQFIKEGIWSDNSYIDDNAYYYDAKEVSNTSAVPQVEWTISAIDVSVLDEMKEFSMDVGDKTILVDNEFFGIQKSAVENYVFEVIITGIEEHLDEQLSNKIEVRNYSTSFEDVFQRIAAATQTLELKEQIYDKATYFTKDGQVDTDVLQNSLIQNSLILANSSDNSYQLDETGLSLQSIINPLKKMRAVADGIFFSNSIDLITGEPKWRAGITADGMNADLITAGQVNTSLVKILSNGQPSFSWGELGLTAYQDNVRTKAGKIAAIGDSYSTRIDGKYTGWITELRRLGLDVVGSGVGGSGFNPYYYLNNYSYMFYNQLKKILEANKENLPSVIIIGGGFNDKNMDITPYVDPSNNTKTDIDNSTKKRWYVGSEFENKDKGHIVIGSEKYNNGHFMLNGYTEQDGQATYNNTTYTWKANTDPKTSNKYSEDAELSVLKSEIESINTLIASIYKGKTYPRVILCTMGRYKYLEPQLKDGLYSDTAPYSHVTNMGMLDDVYTVYKDAVASINNKNGFKDKDGKPLNKWYYFDMSGIKCSFEESWFGRFYGTPEAAYQDKEQSAYSNGDNVHPGSDCHSVMADILYEYLIDTGAIDVSYLSGESFLRMDKFGLYSVSKNASKFGYTSTAEESYPWFIGYTDAQAKKLIQENADFSLTDLGLRLNVKGTNGNISLGYSEDCLAYGLYIKDGQGNDVVKLQNNGDCSIAEWAISYSALFGEKYSSDRTERRVMYLANPSNGEGDGYTNWVMAAGLIGATDSFDKCNFRVDSDGILYAAGAHISGNFSINSLSSFSVIDNMLKFTSQTFYEGTGDNRKKYHNVFVLQNYPDLYSGTGEGYNALSLGQIEYQVTQTGNDIPNLGDCSFRVTSKGYLHAAGATISGNITAKSGKIANFNIEENLIYTKDSKWNVQSSLLFGLNTSAYGTSDSIALALGALESGKDPSVFSNWNDLSFTVTRGGTLTAKSANIEGVFKTGSSDNHYLTVSTVYFKEEESNLMPAIKFIDKTSPVEGNDYKYNSSLFTLAKSNAGYWTMYCGFGINEGTTHHSTGLFRFEFENGWVLPYFDGYFKAGNKEGGLFFINKTTRAELNGYYLWIDSNGNLRYNNNYVQLSSSSNYT